MKVSNFFSILRISSAGISAEKKLLAITAENIANANTTRTIDGTPYKRKRLIKEVNSQHNFFARELRNAGLKLHTANSNHISQSNYTPLGVDRGRMVNIKTSVEEMNQFRELFDPEHPDADDEGIVRYPDINVVSEMLELISASRAYEANVTVMNATKNLARKSLRI